MLICFNNQIYLSTLSVHSLAWSVLCPDDPFDVSWLPPREHHVAFAEVSTEARRGTHAPRWGPARAMAALWPEEPVLGLPRPRRGAVAGRAARTGPGPGAAPSPPGSGAAAPVLWGSRARVTGAGDRRACAAGEPCPRRQGRRRRATPLTAPGGAACQGCAPAQPRHQGRVWPCARATVRHGR